MDLSNADPCGWMIGRWLSRPFTLPEAPWSDRRRVLCASRRSRLARLALERSSSRTNRARENPDWTPNCPVRLSARWGKCPCQCRCDVYSNCPCYTCRWPQNINRSCCTNRRIRLRTILPWTAPASACRRSCVRNNTTRCMAVHGRSAIRART